MSHRRCDGSAFLLIAEFPIWAQVAQTHPWATLDEIPLETLLAERLILLDSSFGARRVFDAAVEPLGVSYELAAEVGVSKIAQALATAGRGVAVLTDEPAYALHPVEIVGRGGSLQIRLHAAWNPSHYAVGSIRSLVEALAAFAAPVRSR